MAQIRRIGLRKLKELYEQDISQREIAKHFGVSPGAVSSALKRAGITNMKTRIKQGVSMKISQTIFKEVEQTRQINEEMLRTLAQMLADAKRVMNVVKEQIQEKKLTGHSIDRLERIQDLIVKRIKSYTDFQEYLLKTVNSTSLITAFLDLYKILPYEHRISFQRILRECGLPYLPDEFIRHDREDASHEDEVKKSCNAELATTKSSMDSLNIKETPSVVFGQVVI